MNFRLYTFVANHYLSPLQCGLQTAHVVSELSRGHALSSAREAYAEWADRDKTIIICAGGNHQGVLECHAELVRTADGALGMPVALFCEDEQSMNGMATAAVSSFHSATGTWCSRMVSITVSATRAGCMHRSMIPVRSSLFMSIR